MIEADGDVAVLGSSFAGSLISLILQRIGLRPLLVDKKSHPRFALGESTTPISNIVLRDLARRYDLSALLPLTRYGTWKRELPHIMCGPKRGFSFFKHKPGEDFRSDECHSNELLVTASLDDERSDTHWLRADVDAYFAAEVERAGIPHFDCTELSAIEHDNGAKRWTLRGYRQGQPIQIAAEFLIDSTGEGGLLGRMLRLNSELRPFCTNSRAIYAHFEGLTRWGDRMSEAGYSLADHPYDCDDAAVHQVFDGAWMWQLRFDNDVTSAGLAIDNSIYPFDAAVSVDDEWSRWMSTYPSLAKQFANARIVGPTPGQLVRTPRLQRQWETFVGSDWAMLPQTAGIIDALFSTGIAQSLCGIERLTSIFERDWKRETLSASLVDYQRAVRSEIAFVDELVGGCFRLFDRFEHFAAFSMLYFAAATTYERRRLDTGDRSAQFLCADDVNLRDAVASISRRVAKRSTSPLFEARNAGDFASLVAEAIAPFNHAGLCDPAAHNMYRYTATEV